MKALVRSVFVAVCLLFAAGAVFAEQKASVVYEQTTDQQMAVIQKTLESSAVMDDVVAFLNEKFRLKQSLKIKFGGDDGPLFDPDSNEIAIPYSFVDEIKQRFEAADYAKTGVSVDEAVLDALMHTLFHEMGHALIVMYDLPVLGKEEDAVDGLATILLIEYFEGGEEIALSAADLFHLENEDVQAFSHADFWDEHSLDIQRYYSTLCFVYGSNPEEYAHLKTDAEFSDDRAELCIDEYDNAASDWFALLENHIRAD